MSYYEDRNRDSYRRGGSSRDGRGSGGLRRLYVGHVNRYVRERDLKDLFARTGRVKDCEIVSDFAFVEYEDPLDAEDAIREFDGYRLEGERLQVEFAKKGKGQDFRSGPSRGSSFGAGAGAAERCYNCGETGHIARECPTPKGRGERAMRFEENRCFECGQTGHLARNCPERRSGGDRGGERSSRRRSRSRSPVSRSRSRSRSRSPRKASSRSRSPRRETRRSSRDKERSPRQEDDSDRTSRYNDRHGSGDDRY